jgi:lipopolysaccharide/colanic/teichoic acid biosynthesis glycosyltransferase
MKKRLFDVIISFIALLLLLPLFLIIGIAIKLGSRGPVFYKGKRIGRHGEPFGMYKFRSMIVNAASIGPSVTYQNDPRITRVGRFLRATKMDEIPQLINVLKGDMSLVGPRPETDDHVIHYTPEQKRVLSVRPGIVGLAQIEWHDEESRIGSVENLDEVYKNIMQEKLALDREYIVHGPSIRRDLSIILRTFSVMIGIRS